MKAAAPVQQLASDQSVMGYIAHVRKNGDQQKLSDHLLGVASLASGNAAKLDLAMVGELLGILHDLGKYSTAFPSEPTPCSANMFLARSMPSVTISMISPPGHVDEFANPILALRCRFRAQSARPAWDGEVPFIRWAAHSFHDRHQPPKEIAPWPST